jgi:hypothetical protein
MEREKKSGILLIVIGLCIPLAVLPFVTGFSKDKSLYDKLYKSSIELRKNTAGETGSNSEPGSTKISILWRVIPQSIPFRFFLVPTAILLYIGIVRIDKARRKKRGEFDSSEADDHDPATPSSQAP